MRLTFVRSAASSLADTARRIDNGQLREQEPCLLSGIQFSTNEDAAVELFSSDVAGDAHTAFRDLRLHPTRDGPSSPADRLRPDDG